MDSKLCPWPDDFPDNVPPESADDAQGLAYRLVKNNPPMDNDFVGHNKEPHKKSSKNLKASDYGTSMFRCAEKIRTIRQLNKPQRNKLVAAGELKPAHGKMSKENKKTSHFETWLREGTGVELAFVIEEE